MSVSVISCRFYRFYCVGRILHAQGIEQFLLKHHIPIRSARGCCHDAARQQMRDVGIGECRAETRHRFDIAERANQRRLFVVEHDENVVDQWRESGALGK